ncbi:MAG: DnaJ domain-containing protein [Hyphomicrobiales bacterium]|nr:DnaJ domain-containing protein [Hyphomicrobiales bacterium]
MKIDSPLFDRIRVKPDKDRRLRAQCPGCEWPSCVAPATHRAPKGRQREREYWQFCLDHVREYNHSYNFFAGMSTDDISRYQREAAIGHRPTWKMGMNGGRPTTRSHSSRFRPEFAGDPFDVFREFGDRARPREDSKQREARAVRNAERKALDVLGLDADASPQEVKTRFKSLVKRHHPDANGGDRSSEDKLREIIQAYNYLKSIGFR